MTNQRYSTSIQSVVVNNQTIQACQAIEYGDFASGVVHVPTNSSIASLTWFVSTKINDEYVEARNSDGTGLVQVVTGGQAYPIPIALNGARFLKIFGDEEGVVSVTLKD
jgi:hypothetical protein